MKTSLIATVLNEENSIGVFLDSILKQTRLPDEVVIVDGGSTDATTSVISNFKSRISNFKLKLIQKTGNRSVGRNIAVKNSTFDVIVVSDADCILDRRWLENITKPFSNISNKSIDVVSGYYKGKAKNIFQKCLIPYVLVMSDRVNPDNFLPSTRSMALRKSAWRKLNGFNEKLSHNEDYEFALRIKKSKIKSVFAKNAIVYWAPRKNLKEAFTMFFRFALGDAESGIIRPKVILLFARYLTGLVLVVSFLVLRSHFILYALYFILAVYIVWAIVKNYRYVNNYWALLILPILQINSDVAVILGTSLGITKGLMRE